MWPKGSAEKFAGICTLTRVPPDHLGVDRPDALDARLRAIDVSAVPERPMNPGVPSGSVPGWDAPSSERAWNISFAPKQT